MCDSVIHADAALISDHGRVFNSSLQRIRVFASYVGHAHPSLWSLLEALQVDEATASTDIKKDARGDPPSKLVKRAVREHQQRLQQLCADRRDGRKTIAQVLSVLEHCVRLHV